MSHTASTGRPSLAYGWKLAAAGVAVALATAGAFALSDHGTGGHESATAQDGGVSRGEFWAVRARTMAIDNVPTAVRIVSVGINAQIGTLGLNRDGTVQVPANPDRVGWYRLGPEPGQPGSAVLLGHVDSVTGPAVFYRLARVPIGARIQVGLADGHTLRFTVKRVATYLNWNFPAAAVYRNQGSPTLTLVTCGGLYARALGGYQENVVVTANLDRQ